MSKVPVNSGVQLEINLYDFASGKLATLLKVFVRFIAPPKYLIIRIILKKVKVLFGKII